MKGDYLFLNMRNTSISEIMKSTIRIGFFFLFIILFIDAIHYAESNLNETHESLHDYSDWEPIHTGIAIDSVPISENTGGNITRSFRR